MEKAKRKLNMVTDPPAKTMLLFAFPMILGNLFQQFYNIIDSVVVGKFVGEDALAAVGASYAITNVFIAIAIGGGVGSAVIVSQFFGARQIGNMKTAISTTLVNFLIIGVVLGLFGFFYNQQILHWLNTPDNVFQDASDYLSIYFIGLPFLFMYNVQASIFNSLGDSKTPLALLIFSSLLNIILDVVFVVAFHWAVMGVAVATLMAQGVSAVISFGVLVYKVKGYKEKEYRGIGYREKGYKGNSEFRFYDSHMVGSMVKVALPSILQQSIVHMGMLLVQSVVNGFGSAVMAGYAAATRIESISIVPMLAIGNAMSTFSAQNMGAGKPERVRYGYKVGCAMVGVSAIVLCILSLLGGKYFLMSFLNPESGQIAYETGVRYVTFMGFFYVWIGLKATTDGLLRGAGDVVVFTLANLVNLSIRVFVAFRFAPVWGISAVWTAVPMGWAANFLLSFSRYLTGKWSQIKLVRK